MAHKIYSVSELNKYINQIIKSDEILADLYIKGEISNFYHHNSGHMYFTIKDEKSAVKAVMFKSSNKNLKFELKDGLEVTASGYIGVYEPRGQYQFYVNDITPKGTGSLHLANEQLKERLEKEIKRLEGLITGTEKKLSNEKFVNNAPEKVVAKEKEKLSGLKSSLTEVKDNLNNLK